MTTANIQLKGLSREQVYNLLPEGLISLCWRGSVAHGMYVPKNEHTCDRLAPVEESEPLGCKAVAQGFGMELSGIC